MHFSRVFGGNKRNLKPPRFFVCSLTLYFFSNSHFDNMIDLVRNIAKRTTPLFVCVCLPPNVVFLQFDSASHVIGMHRPVTCECQMFVVVVIVVLVGYFYCCCEGNCVRTFCPKRIRVPTRIASSLQIIAVPDIDVQDAAVSLQR